MNMIKKSIKPLKSPSIISIFGMCIQEEEKGHVQKEERGQLDSKRTKLVLQKGSFQRWKGGMVDNKKGIFPRLCCMHKDFFYVIFLLVFSLHCDILIAVDFPFPRIANTSFVSSFCLYFLKLCLCEWLLRN